jgi:hypothetical protein
MRRFPLHFRLRTLLIAIAIIGLGLGGYRWWVGRREMLRMAFAHETQANRIARMAPGIGRTLASNRKSLEILTIGVQSFEKPALQHPVMPEPAGLGEPAYERAIESLNRTIEKVGRQRDETVAALERDVMALRNELEKYERLNDLRERRQRWHQNRAQELCRTLVFNLTREHQRDLRQNELFDQEGRHIDIDFLNFTITDHDQRAALQESAAQELVRGLGKRPLVGRYLTDRRIREHSRYAQSYRQHAETARQALRELQRKP